MFNSVDYMATLLNTIQMTTTHAQSGGASRAAQTDNSTRHLCDLSAEQLLSWMRDERLASEGPPDASDQIECGVSPFLAGEAAKAAFASEPQETVAALVAWTKSYFDGCAGLLALCELSDALNEERTEERARAHQWPHCIVCENSDEVFTGYHFNADTSEAATMSSFAISALGEYVVDSEKRTPERFWADVVYSVREAGALHETRGEADSAEEGCALATSKLIATLADFVGAPSSSNLRDLGGRHDA